MNRLDKFMDWFFPVCGIGFVLFLIMIVIGSCGHYNERYNMKELNSDREYFFTTKQVGSHEILIVSNRYDDKSFQIVDLGESKIEKDN